MLIQIGLQFLAPVAVLTEFQKARSSSSAAAAEDGADEAGNGVFMGEPADHIGAPLDLAIQTLDRVGRVELRAMGRKEAHIGQYVGFGLVHRSGQFWHTGPRLVGDLPPLSAGESSIVHD
jgi:hypothetical protein